MKVIHIIDSGGFYGAEIMLLNLCVEQIKQGLDVEVLSIGSINSTPKAIEIKLHEVSVPCTPWRMRPLPDPRESMKILSYCKMADADIIHSHGYKGNILLGIIPKRLRTMPIVTTIHGYTRCSGFSKLMVYQWIDRFCLRNLDAVVLVSESIRSQIPVKGIQKLVHIIANGIPEEITETGTYKSLLHDGQFKLGALGRLSHEKNFIALIDAMVMVKKEKPHAKLIIYGEGDERSALESRVKELNLQGSVELPGYLDDTYAFLKELDLFLNSSITEGMPISLLEAMRAETNIIATNIPANEALLGKAKHIVQTCDVNATAIAEAILKFSNINDANIERQKIENKNIFLEKYTVKKMVNNYQDLYKNLSKKNGKYIFPF